MHLTFEIFSLNYQIIHLMADKKLGLVRKRAQNCLLLYVLQFFFKFMQLSFLDQKYVAWRVEKQALRKPKLSDEIPRKSDYFIILFLKCHKNPRLYYVLVNAATTHHWCLYLKPIHQCSYIKRFELCFIHLKIAFFIFFSFKRRNF